MTVLDTFYLLFKSNAAEAAQDTAKLDKQIAELASKGQKRSEAEAKQLKELRKQRTEITRDIKDQTVEVDKLGQSFVKTIENAAAAGTALFSFGALKAGVKTATDFNSQLQITARLLGQSPASLSAFANAAELAGGTKEGAIAQYKSLFDFYSARGLKSPTPENLLGALRRDLAKRGTPEGKALLLQQLGISDTGVATLGQESQGAFDAHMSGGRRTGLSETQIQKLRDLAEAEAEASQELARTFGVLGAEISDYLIPALKAFSGFLNDISNIPGGSTALGAAGVVGGGFLGGKLAGGLLRMLGAGTAAAGGSIAGAAAAIGAGTWGLLSLEEALIEHYFGKKTSQPDAPPTDGKRPPLGIRTNNPGNLRPGGKQANYKTPEEGISNLADQLRRYGSRGWDTIEEIISRYAPPVENDTQSYINAVSRQTGFKPGQKLDLNDAATLQKLVPAIIKHENGYNPYDDAMVRSSILAGKSAFPGSDVGRGTPGGASKTLNVKTGDIIVNTQATDAQGMANGAATALQSQIRNAMNGWDDGVGY